VATFAEGPLPPGSDELTKLRATLMAAGLEGTSATLLVAGTSSACGKTAVAVGLAGELARDLVHNVLLIDADVKRPGVARILQVDHEFDLADVLEGRADPSEAILYSEGDNLSAMPLRADPLLGSSRLTAETLAGPVSRDMLARLQETFDYIVVDCGTIDDSAVPSVLAARASGVVLVLPVGTGRERARACRAAIQSAGGRVIGAVLTGTVQSRTAGE
jgi:Mrp family chromosome partitioning ATPase